MGDIFDDYINGVKKKKQERLGISEGTDIFDKYIQDVQTKSAERKAKQTAERNEAIYMSNMSPTEQGAYKRAKESNGAYSSPYLKEGREGKSDLVYGYDKWNRLSKANKEKWFDYAEQNKSKSDEPWEAKYAREILAGNSTRSKTAAQKNSEFLNKITAGLLPVWENKDGIPDELFDIESEKKWMWNSLPEDVKNGLRNAPGAWSQTVAKLTGKGEDADYVNRYNDYRKAEEYLKQYYNDDEIEMLKKYAEMVEDLEDVQTIKEIQSDLMASNPVYANVIAPIQQIGADIGASALSAPRTLWDLATERGNYSVVNPYKGNLQKAAEAGRGVQQEILEGLEGNTFMQNYYSASVSTAESAMRLALARGVASGLTSTTAFSSLPYDQVAGITMNALMFPSVVEQTATEMVQKGMPANQAIAKAVSAGIFECLFETVSFDKLGFFQEKPIVGNIKTFAANLLKSGFVEGSEEVATDIANELYDYFAAYDYSDFKAYKDKLEAQTGEEVTDLEAWDGYKKEFADKLLKSFIGGAVSGLTMGAASNAQGIANARALNAKGETVSDADAERMRSVVDNVAAYNPNVRELMENTMGNETTVRGAMADVIEQMEKTYIKSIEKATTEKQLNTVMENLNTNLNGLISENAFNAYNAKLIELGKEGADYQTFLTNRDKGNQTTFSDLVYGTGDNYISRQYTEAKNEMENAMRNTTNGMNMEERIASVERAAELMSKSQELAEDIVAKYGEQGKTLDSPELRKYVGILGEESAARALTLGKLARESNTENVNLKGGRVYELKDTAEIERMLGKGAAEHLKSAEYNEVKNNPLFRVVSVMTGANVAFYASDQHLSVKNGAYDPKTNTFYFDANAGTSGTHAALGEVISHELTHWIRANNEAGYDRLYMFVRNDMGEEAFDSLVKEHMDRLGLDTNVAAEEVVAEACQRMLSSSETFMRYAAADTEGAKSLLSRLKDFIKKLRNAFRGSLNNEATRLIEDYEGLAAEWEKALNEAISNSDGLAVREAMEGKENITKSIEKNADGDMTVAELNDGTLMYSERTYFNGGKQAIEAQLRKQGFSEEDIRKTTDRIDKHLAYIHKVAEQYATQNFPNLLKNLGTDITTDLATEAEILDMMEKDGSVSQEIINNLRSQHQVAYAYVSNGDYAMNIDLQLSCKKRIAYEMVINELVKSGAMADVRMSGELIGKINMILAANEFETQCLGCFVESRRLQMQKWAETIVEEWNQQVERITGKKRDKATKKKSYLFHGETAVTAIDAYQAHLFLENSIKSGERGRADNGGIKLKSDSVYDKMGELISFNPKLYGKFISVDDVLTADGLMNIRKIDNGNMFSLVKQRYGAASPKILQSFNPYNSEILNLTFKSVKEMTGNGVTGNQKYTSAARKALTAEDKAVINKVAYEQFGAGEMNAKDRKALIKRLTDERIETDAIRQYLLDVGGNRIQSFSDFMIENVFDMLQIFNDFAIRNFSVHGYTKEQICLRLFGMTGAKWNGSWISHNIKEMGKELAGLMPYTEENAKNGITVEVDGEKYVIQFDDYARHVRERSFIQSIGFRDAIAIMLDPRYSDNVGTITIGFSDKHIRAMLNNPYFRMVIPYHASGMIPGFADLVGASTYNDYTNYQNTTLGTVKVYKDGKLVGEYKHSDVAGQGVYKDKKGLFVAHNGKSYKINPDMSFNFNEALQRLGDAKAAADEYVAWCRSEHDIRSTTRGKNAVNYDGLVIVAEFNPKFSDSPMGYDFTQEQNYYKLLEDFNVYNSREEIINGVSVNARQNGVQSLFPGDEGGTLSAEQLAQYRADLKQTGLFSEKDIEKYVKKAQMTFDELIGEEVAGRNAYYENVFGKNNEKFDKALGEIKEAMKDFQRLDEIANSKEEHLDNPDMKPTAGTYMGRQRNSMRDTAYMNAVQSGNMEEAQRYVDEAAREAGYPLKFMHGTNSFGFTTIEYGQSDDGISFFGTDDEEVASTYIRPMEDEDATPHTYVREIGKPHGKIVSASSSIPELIAEYDRVTGKKSGFRPATQKDIDKLLDTRIATVKRSANDLLQYSIPDNIDTAVKNIVNANTADEIISAAEAIKDEWNIYYNGEYFEQASFALSNLKDMLNNLQNSMKLKADNIAIYDALNLWRTKSDMVDEILDNGTGIGTRGTYELYGTRKNELVIDCNGSQWNKILVPDVNGMREDLGDYAKTRDISKWANDHGYGVVIFNEVKDTGQYGSRFTPASTVYAFTRDGGESIKSADTVTYTDDGEIIPPSERFNKEEKDIRYSTREVGSGDGFKIGKRVAEALEKINNGEMLSEKEFYNVYSAHKLDLRRNYADNMGELVGKILSDGMVSGMVNPSSTFRYTEEKLKNGETLNYTEGRYAPKKGDYYVLVTPDYLNKGDYIVKGYKPHPQEIVRIERDNQPLYEAYRNQFEGSAEQVRYSTRDSSGRTLTPGQQEYFAESKVRDENGNLKRMYHGTENAGFTVFDTNAVDDGRSFFFTDDPIVAKTYSGSYSEYAPQRDTFDLETLNRGLEEGWSDRQLEKKGDGFVLVYNGNTEEETFDTLEEATEYIREEFPDSIEAITGEEIVNSTNYAVYLNITNPMVVDAKGSGWDYITPDNAIEVKMKYEDGEWTVTHNGEVVEVSDPWNYGDAIGDTDLQEELDELADSDEDSATFQTVLDETGSYAIEYESTRTLAEKAQEEGYDGVIINNVLDTAIYGTAEEQMRTSTVAIAFESNQIKSINNANPTENEDIRFSYRDLANSESEILINALKNDAALVDELGAKQSIEAYAREYNRLKEMENQQIEITKQLRKKDTSPSEREVLLKKMVRLDRAIINKTTELTEMRNQRVIRDLLISEWDKRDTLVAAGRAEERYLTRKALEEKYGKELSALKEKTRQQKQEIRDRHTINERKANIIKKTKQLMDMCLHPTEKKKVPTVLINPIVELLDAIDYWTPAEGRRVTKKSESLRERFVNFREAINEYQEQINEGTEQIEYMFDPEFLETVDELAKSVKGINNVNDMNAEEITALDQTLTQLYHLISRGNKMITASHYQTVNEYTDKTRQAMEKRKTLSEKTSAKGNWLSRLNAGMADAYAFGEYAGEGTREIVDMLSKAFEDKEFHVKEAIEFTQEVLKPYKKELKKWSQDEHEFTLSTTDNDGNPNKVKLTVGQMMELYLLNKREQARGHIYGGGIRVENRKGKFTESVKIAEQDVAEIMEYLKSVPGAMEVADKLQQYGATTITGWGNQASNLMYGISKFTDENYWQIRSDSSSLKDNENTEKALNASMYRLQNMGRTKAVKKGANNAIYIGDVFDTWSNTIDEMTSYASILPATTDAMRWWNSRVELDGENTVRVKKLLESKLGTDMTRVFTDTIKALNGGIMGTDSLESLVKKLTGKAKAAAVAGNLRVVLQQPTAYTRAAAVIDKKYLLKALMTKPNAKEAQEHSAIAWHKAQGFYSNGLAPSLRKMVIGDASIGENLTEKALWLAGKADDLTWGYLWNASKLKVEAENKALKVGSDAYWNEVNKVFSNIINQTQVVDTPLTKSTWMRGNGLGVYFTAFMAEPTKTYSMVMERLDRVLQNPTSKDAWRAFAGVGAVFAVNAMVNAMAQALADAARDDDKEKDYWEKYIEKYQEDVKDNINPLTYIPVVKDIWSLSQGYSNSNLSMQAAQNTVYAVNELKKIANGTSKKTLFGQTETVAKAISGWTGIPVGNVMRTLNSIGNVAGVDIFRRKKYTNSELGRNVVLSMNEGDTSAADKYMAELVENCKGDTNKANNYVITYLADHDNEIDAWADRYMEDATTINDAIDAMSDKYSSEIVTKAIRKSVNNDADEDDKIKTSNLAESQYTSDDINRMLENGKVTEAQDIIDEINAKYKEMGSKTTAKNAVTAYWKPKYLAASGEERDKILKMLYKLKNNGQQMYSSKDIAKWS